MTVQDAVVSPDERAIRAHIEHITRRWAELDQPCVVEVRFLTPEDRARVTNVARFSPDDMGLSLAVDHIAAMNKARLNAYVVVNPIDGAASFKANEAAKDENIVASFFHWADADDATAAENIKSFVGPKPTFFVLTGTQPSPRPHVYWELEEPTRNLQAWRATQSAIAETLKTDASVINPSRIMRVGGTINWPKPQKQGKGYVAELTQIVIHDEDSRPLVSSERMARAFTARPADAATGTATRTGTDWIDGFQTLDRERLKIQALSGQEWHHAVIRLVASYVGKGLSDEEIHALTDPLTLAGYTVDETRREVQTAIDGARKKGWTPPIQPLPQPLTPEEKDAIPAAIFKVWERKDIAAIPYPEFVYSDFYARGYTSLTLASPKVGKSMLGLAEALDMATGRGFLTGYSRPPLRVVYYNAEDDQNVLDARVAALLELYGIDQSEIEGRFWPTSGVENEDFFLVAGQEGMINEPLFVALEKFCNEQRADVLIFDPLQDLSASPETNEVFRAMGQRLRRMASQCKVSLGLIHHTRKIAPGMQATIEDGRGGSALRGTARFNRILNPMTEDEAAKAGVENHRFFFRIGDMESNLAPPSSDVNRWFEKVSIPIANGRSIGAVRPWDWPDAFNGISPQDAAKVRNAVDRMAEPPRENVRSPAWVGEVVADVLGLNLTKKTDKERVKILIAGWIKSDVLRVTEEEDKRAGRTVKVVIAGANNPLAAGGQSA